MPRPEIEDKHPPANDPTYCLLESDSLISGYDVSTGRLLFPQTTHPHEVHILIEVAVNLLRVGEWNQPLLGN